MNISLPFSYTMNTISLRVSLMALLTLLAHPFCFGQVKYSVSLRDVQDDRLQVTVNVPRINSNTTEYHMPKVVPGTYSVSDFGRFVVDFKAFGMEGNELPVSKIDGNRWKIDQAQNLQYVKYWVIDTWDTELSPKIFEPAGTNFEAGKNFVLNPFGLFGYFPEYRDQPCEVTVTYPEDMYGSTALISERVKPGVDLFKVDSYHHLADSPIMYCKPDTAWKKVGNADVLVSVYSPNKRVRASAVMESLAEILAAQKDYLGGTLPVEKYAFVIYLTPGTGGSGGMGALEHSYSSFYFMPESDEASSAAQMRDVAAHEFFHIVTPLSIHSEEIHYFDYVEPKMSKHLWLYEGVTEYSAGHMQVKHGLITLSEYMGTIQQKIMMASFMNDTVPFTVMSAGCLDKYKAQYMNVYQKGALIGMCVDILLREYSDGKMGIQELMKKLAEKYGKSQPFKDNELFDVIGQLSYPQIRDFFKTYVEGKEPIPYGKFLAKAGILYEAASNREVLTTGRFATKLNPATNRLYVANVRHMNEFGEKLKIKEGDEIIRFDGMEVTNSNFEDVIAKFRAKRKEGDKIYVEVARPEGEGYKTVTLKAKAMAVRQKGTHMLSVDPNATPEQLALRKAWINI